MMVAQSTVTQRAKTPLRALPTLATGPAVVVVVLLDASPKLHEGYAYAHKVLMSP